MGKRSVAFGREELELLVGPRFDQIHAGHYLRAGTASLFRWRTLR